MERGAVITGAGVICSLGDSPAAVHRALSEGQRGISRVSEVDAGGTAAAWAAQVAYDLRRHLGPRNTRPLDRAAQLATSAAALALADGGIPGEASFREGVGVVVGTLFASVRTIIEFDRRAISVGPEYVSPIDFANTVANATAGQIAIWHGLRAINTTVAGAHGGAYAIAHASDFVQRGIARALLAGGAEEVCGESLEAFAVAGLLCNGRSGDTPRPVPFDADRAGFVLGEGAAFVVVEDAAAAAQRGAPTKAHILGHATVCGGRAGGEAGAIARAIDVALGSARLRPDEIDMVSASASGSVAGDAAEARGLAAALGPRAARVPVAALKGMLGETLGAGGALQVVSVLETMRSGILPGIPDFVRADADVSVGGLSAESRSVSVRTALVVSAWGGSCTALVLGRADDA